MAGSRQLVAGPQDWQAAMRNRNGSKRALRKLKRRMIQLEQEKAALQWRLDYPGAGITYARDTAGHTLINWPDSIAT